MRPHPAGGFEWIDTLGGLALVCRPLEPFAGHLFTTRGWSLGSSDRTEANEIAAWAIVADALGRPPSGLARLRQVHGNAVVVRRAGRLHNASEQPDADIIVSNDPGLVLAIQTADCVPLVMADTRTGAVAAAHAGWRGLAARVPDVVVRAMTDQFGTRPGDLIVAVGPSISAPRYEVGTEVRSRFEDTGYGSDLVRRWFPVETRQSHWLFDGWQSVRDQLECAGVRAERIHIAQLCTADHPELFCSYRRDGRKAGRMAAAIRARSDVHSSSCD
jgi:YfiH family protein